MRFGEKLKELRNEKNYTQENLAEILKVSRSTISSWEIGRSYPDLDMIIYLSDLFEISLDNLLKQDSDVTNKIMTKNRINKYVKKVIYLILFFMGIFLLCNVVWVIKNSSTYSVEKKWKDNGSSYVLQKGDMTYIVNKPKYLSFNSEKDLFVKSNVMNIEWMFSSKEIYGKLYLKFISGNESSFIINDKIKFDEALNSEIGLSFSSDEKKEIDEYLNNNYEKIRNIYKEGYQVWEKIE